MLSLSVSHFEPGRMGEAYMLIRHLAHIGPEQWERYCLQLASSGGGVLAVRGEDQCVHGVAAYLPVASLKYGNTLSVEAFAAFEFGGSMLVRKTLSAALDDLARKKDCNVVTFSLEAKGLANPDRRQRWESLGLTADRIEFVRRIDQRRPIDSQ